MLNTLVILTQIIVTSGILYLAYRLLFDGKADYRFCRLYLVSLPIVSALVPLFDIPLTPAEVIWISSEAELPAQEALWNNEELWRTLTFIIYLVVCGVILALGVRQLHHIGRIRRSALRAYHKQYRLYRTHRQIVPFSLWRSIYISCTTKSESEKMILTHEESHIRRGHTFERPISEIWKVLLWWSPFTWLAALKLVEVQEEEADHDVLQAGFKPKEYLSSIFDLMFGFQPSIANHYSKKFTKRRFKAIAERKARNQMRSRRWLLVPIMALLMGLFSFTTPPTEYRILDQPTNETMSASCLLCEEGLKHESPCKEGTVNKLAGETGTSKQFKLPTFEQEVPPSGSAQKQGCRFLWLLKQFWMAFKAGHPLRAL